MRSRELQSLLSSMTKRPVSEIDQRVRPLRMASEIKFGPRGHSAPHMSLAEAAFHLLSMASRRASDAGSVQRRLTVNCRYVPHPDLPDFLPAGTSFASALTLYLDDPTQFGGAVEMAEDGSAGWIGKLTNGRMVKLYFRDPADDRAAAIDASGDYELAEHSFIGGRFVIGAAGMMHIGNQVRETEPEAPKLAKAG